MSIDASTYTITIQKIIIDGDNLFEATIKELPDVVDYAETYNEAYELAIDSIETTAEMLEEDGRDMPKPQERNDDYSGRVTLRLPKSLHKKITLLAKSENTSINYLIVAAMSEKVAIGSFVKSNLMNLNNRILEAVTFATQTVMSQPHRIVHQKFTENRTDSWVAKSTDRKILHIGGL